MNIVVSTQTIIMTEEVHCTLTSILYVDNIKYKKVKYSNVNKISTISKHISYIEKYTGNREINRMKISTQLCK